MQTLTVVHGVLRKPVERGQWLDRAIRVWSKAGWYSRWRQRGCTCSFRLPLLHVLYTSCQFVSVHSSNTRHKALSPQLVHIGGITGTTLMCVCSDIKPVQDNMQQLSYLCLGGLCLTDAEARAVASMRRLRELELHNAPELSLTGLTHLTRMRELSKLTLKGVGCRRGIECALTTDPNVSHEARVPGGGVSAQ